MSECSDIQKTSQNNQRKDGTLKVELGEKGRDTSRNEMELIFNVLIIGNVFAPHLIREKGKEKIKHAVFCYGK